MKKVLLTISRGSIARNLLQNEFYRLLRENFLVTILTPAWQDERFLKEFSHPNVTFLPLAEKPHTRGEAILFFFHKYLVYNSTVNQKARWGIIGDSRSEQPSYLLFLFRKTIFLPLSKLGFLREFVRFIDYHFFQRDTVRLFQGILQKENPDVVIVTNISDDTEAALLKACRKEEVTSIAIPKSWDNLSKHGFRAKSDYLVVWNEFMQHQARRYHNYSKKRIRIIGVPQFDLYSDKKRLLSREEFCELYRLDPAKRIIVFGSEGKLFPSDADITSIIAGFIKRGELGTPSQLLIRPHYGYKDDEQKFKGLFDVPDVRVDLFNNPSPVFRDRWDYSSEFDTRFASMLAHADVLINTASTLSLDAVSFDKPIINIAFDGPVTLPYEESIARWYETDYYQAILRVRATTVVTSADSLKDAIRIYLTNPGEKGHERESLRDLFCYKLDGGAGRRFFDFVTEIVGNERAKKSTI